MPPVTKTCPQCGAPISGDVSGGQCLRCLLRLGLERGEPEEGEAPALEVDDEFPGYRILDEIGEGGCGVVYRSLQTGAIRREVAVKVIKLGLDTRAVISRFEAERQALALMNHPHIAKVFDAGTTRRGRPFFVMEFVDGVGIAEYCDREKLSIRKRLELFLSVCDAVRHAHLKGVIHRDLKPSNILVAESGLGEPVPKVIDFGIAKAIDGQRLAERTNYTAFDRSVGTPAYMSPEQTGIPDGDIDTRSDIYSLGVLLYELLAGCPPFDPKRLQPLPLTEACRIVREEDPPSPSARLSSLEHGESLRIAERRLCGPRRLAGELRGDLDRIVMKAMEKSRDRRYDTAGDLADDILRRLRNEPIEARGPGAWYRIGRFIRRNRLPFIAATAVLGSLLAGAILASTMYFKEKQARQRLELRAYFADMHAALRAAEASSGGLASTVNLLDAWRDRVPDPRGWEWYYLHGLCHRERLSIDADRGVVWTLAWSPDGKLLATGGEEGLVKIWNADDGAAVSSHAGHEASIRSIAWSSDGRRIASSSQDSSLRLWEAGSDDCRILARKEKGFFNLAWEPAGSRLAGGGTDARVRLWDAEHPEQLTLLRAERVVNGVCWSPDGGRLFACGNQGLVAAWETGTGAQLWSKEVANTQLLTIACSPDGRRLTTGGHENAVHFRDPDTGARISSLFDNQNVVTSIAWAPTGEFLASATLDDGRIAIRDPSADGRVIRRLRGHLASVHGIAWRPDGGRLASASADGTVKIWDAAGDDLSARLLQLPDQGKCLAWSPDSTRLAVGPRRTDAWIWDLRQGFAPRMLDGGHTPWTHAIAWNPEGTLLATGGDKGLRIWDVETSALIWKDDETVSIVRGLAWRPPDGRLLAGVVKPSHLVLWDAAQRRLIRTLELPLGEIGPLQWSPDGSALAAASGKEIFLFDDKLLRTATLSGHREPVGFLAWSPDGRQIASGSSDTTARIWDVRTAQPVRVLNGHGSRVTGVAWSPDGTRLLTGGWDMTARLWDPDTGTEIVSLDPPPGIVQMISAVAWSPDGRKIAITDIEGGACVLDATPGRQTVAGKPAAIPPCDPETGAVEAARSLRLYCETVEPIAANDPDALRRTAWVRATSPYAEVRDGAKAVEAASQGNELTGGRSPGLLRILAAAHAEAGDFPKAIATLERARSLATTTEIHNAILADLRLYQAGKPLRDNSW